MTRARPLDALLAALASLAVGAWAVHFSKEVRIGDTQAGVPELRPDSRYNRDSQLIASKCSIGVDLLSVIVETVPDAGVDHEVMTLLDEFEVSNAASIVLVGA